MAASPPSPPYGTALAYHDLCAQLVRRPCRPGTPHLKVPDPLLPHYAVHVRHDTAIPADYLRRCCAESGVHVLSAAKMMGKSQAIQQFCRGRSVLFVTFSVSLSYQVLEELETARVFVVHYLRDAEAFQRPPEAHARPVVRVVVINSLWRVPTTVYDAVILDESESILGACVSETFGGLIAERRLTVVHRLLELIRQASVVAVADAMITEHTLEFGAFVASARDEAQAHLHEFTHRPQAGRYARLWTNAPEYLRALVSDVLRGTRVVVAASTRAFALRTHNFLLSELQRCGVAVDAADARDEPPPRRPGRPPLRVRVGLVVWSDMLRGGHVNAQWRSLDVLIYSPCISAGVSFTVRGHFKRCYTVVSGGFEKIPDVRTQLQMTSRVRDVEGYEILLQAPRRRETRFRAPAPRVAGIPAYAGSYSLLQMFRYVLSILRRKAEQTHQVRLHAHEDAFLRELAHMGVEVTQIRAPSCATARRDRGGEPVFCLLPAARIPSLEPSLAKLETHVWNAMPQPLELQRLGVLPREAPAFVQVREGAVVELDVRPEFERLHGDDTPNPNPNAYTADLAQGLVNFVARLLLWRFATWRTALAAEAIPAVAAPPLWLAENGTPPNRRGDAFPVDVRVLETFSVDGILEKHTSRAHPADVVRDVRAAAVCVQRWLKDLAAVPAFVAGDDHAQAVDARVVPATAAVFDGYRRALGVLFLAMHPYDRFLASRETLHASLPSTHDFERAWLCAVQTLRRWAVALPGPRCAVSLLPPSLAVFNISFRPNLIVWGPDVVEVWSGYTLPLQHWVREVDVLAYTALCELALYSAAVARGSYCPFAPGNDTRYTARVWRLNDGSQCVITLDRRRVHAVADILRRPSVVGLVDGMDETDFANLLRQARDTASPHDDPMEDTEDALLSLVPVLPTSHEPSAHGARRQQTAAIAVDSDDEDDGRTVAGWQETDDPPLGSSDRWAMVLPDGSENPFEGVSLQAAFRRKVFGFVDPQSGEFEEQRCIIFDGGRLAEQFKMTCADDGSDGVPVEQRDESLLLVPLLSR